MVRGLVERFVSDVVNDRHLEVLAELCHADVMIHPPLGSSPLRGIDGVREVYAVPLTAFEDLHMDVVDVIVDQDMAVLHAVVSGTHTGPLGADFPPCGRSFADVPEVTVFACDGGAISEMWLVPNTMLILQQLGLIPSGPPPKVLVAAMALKSRFAR